MQDFVLYPLQVTDRKAWEREVRVALEAELADRLATAKERHQAELEAIRQELAYSSLKKGQVQAENKCYDATIATAPFDVHHVAA